MWITHQLTRNADGRDLWLRWNTTLGGVWIMEGREGDDPEDVKDWYLERDMLTAAAREWLETVEAEEGDRRE